MSQLTPRQAELFSFIHDFITKNQYPPSHRQIAVKLGLRAVRSVQQLLEQLERKGYVGHTPGVSRSLRIIT
jgi:repressor LexA